MYEKVAWGVRKRDEAGGMSSDLTWGSPSRQSGITMGTKVTHTLEGHYGTFQEANQSRSPQRWQGLPGCHVAGAHQHWCPVLPVGGTRGHNSERVGDAWHLKPWGGPRTGHLAPRESVYLHDTKTQAARKRGQCPALRCRSATTGVGIGACRTAQELPFPPQALF